MSIRNKATGTFAVFFITVFLSMNGYSQGSDLTSRERNFYIGLNISPGKSTIMNIGSTAITDMKSIGKSSFSTTLEAGYLFSDYIGLSVGIGYSSLQSDLTLGTFSTNYDTLDITESYKRYITGSNISENQKISFLDIPVLLNLHIPVSRGFGFFLHPGIILSFPLNKSFRSSGTFTYTGYYSAYNVYITGVPFEGLEENYLTKDNGELKIKPLLMELTVTGGVHFIIQEKARLGLGLTYNKFISEISDYIESNSFRLSSKPDQMRSMMEASGAKVSSIGLNISFLYFMR